MLHIEINAIMSTPDSKLDLLICGNERCTRRVEPWNIPVRGC